MRCIAVSPKGSEARDLLNGAEAAAKLTAVEPSDCPYCPEGEVDNAAVEAPEVANEARILGGRPMTVEGRRRLRQLTGKTDTAVGRPVVPSRALPRTSASHNNDVRDLGVVLNSLFPKWSTSREKHTFAKLSRNHRRSVSKRKRKREREIETDRQQE